MSLNKAVVIHNTWATDQEHRLLIFLCAFPELFTPLPNDSFTARAQSKVPTENCVDQQLAQEAILKHGTPVRLLYLIFENWGFVLCFTKVPRAVSCIHRLIGTLDLVIRRTRSC